MADQDPIEYLRDCSQEGAENVMLKQSEIASILRKQIRADVDRLVDSLVIAEIVSLILHRGAELSEIASARQGVLLRFENRRRA
jgi:predicted transcriptional regulator